ncbi:MAG: glycosyltransferase family 4 protein [Anaerolineae bacterium]
MPENLLFTSWYTGLGGGETDLLALAQFLDHDRWRPHLLVPADGVLAQKWREHGWTVHIIPYRGASTYFVPMIWRQFPVVKRFADLLQDADIRLVASEYHTLPLIQPGAQALNIPLMWTVHGWWFRPNLWQQAFFREIPVVARSRSIRDGFLGSPPFMPPDDIPIIYSGVDTDRFRPSPQAYYAEREALELSPDTPLVVMVARFQEVKGHHTFQEMARLVLSQMPDVHFVVAGEDTFGVSKDEAYRQQMLANARTDPTLRERLHYIGFRDDVERVLASADVVVCASTFESYGKVNLEAMACACPVVSTEQGGPSETILHNQIGYLVTPDDASAFAGYVLALLRDPALRWRFGERGRARVLNHFSAQTTAEQYQSFFSELS